MSQDPFGRYVDEPLVLPPAVGSGYWQRSGSLLHVKLPIGFALADAAVLFTTPVRLLLEQAFWEVTTDFAGGSSSAIGLSGSVAPHTTKGDLLGGATGDVAAALTAAIGVTQGTIGVSFSAAPKMAVLEAGSAVRFDRITDAFTSGAGFVHLACRLIF